MQASKSQLGIAADAASFALSMESGITDLSIVNHGKLHPGVYECLSFVFLLVRREMYVCACESARASSVSSLASVALLSDLHTPLGLLVSKIKTADEMSKSVWTCHLLLVSLQTHAQKFLSMPEVFITATWCKLG